MERGFGSRGFDLMNPKPVSSSSRRVIADLEFVVGEYEREKGIAPLDRRKRGVERSVERRSGNAITYCFEDSMIGFGRVYDVFN